MRVTFRREKHDTVREGAIWTIKYAESRDVSKPQKLASKTTKLKKY